MIFVTGGAGFIGSNFVHAWLECGVEPVLNLDKLTYAGNLQNLGALKDDGRHLFVQGDIGNVELVAGLLAQHRPRAIINFAAESHVDRSIADPGAFIETNVVGTAALLNCARDFWFGLDPAAKEAFRFVHVSTDEVYGTLAPDDPAFTESSNFQPNSPYAASKAASDHLVRAWYHTFALPTITTNCSNNYGPFQLPEKLIPLVINNALAGKDLPLYGDGMQVRDWLFVGDHCEAIRCVLEHGKPSETYNIGGWNEKANIEIVGHICQLLDEIRPRSDGRSYRSQITHVADRPGHDRRYAVDAAKIERELGWQPAETFESGIRKTVEWYLSNPHWLEAVQTTAHRDWISRQYATQAVT